MIAREKNKNLPRYAKNVGHGEFYYRYFTILMGKKDDSMRLNLHETKKDQSLCKAFKSHCQQEPPDLESGGRGFKDRLTTIFFLFPSHSYYTFQNFQPSSS